MSISLGPGPEIIPLTIWAKDSVSALFKSTADNFDSAFDSFLAEDVHITVNGKHLTREQYKQLILGEKALERTANVTFQDSVEVPKNKNKPAQAGSVGLFYKAQIIEKVFVLGAPAGRTITSSVNLTIKEYNSDSEDRKVSQLSQVVLDEADPVHLPTTHTSS